MDKNTILEILKVGFLNQVSTDPRTLPEYELTVQEIVIRYNNKDGKPVKRVHERKFDLEKIAATLDQRFQDRIDEIKEIHNEHVDDLRESCKGMEQ